jgi:hypothetical protein
MSLDIFLSVCDSKSHLILEMFTPKGSLYYYLFHFSPTSKEATMGRPPTMVTFQKPSARRWDRGRSSREEDLSQLSESNTLYYKYHPFVWILLMLMAMVLHGWYQTLFDDGGEYTSRYSVFTPADDPIQRQTSELDGHGNDKAVDMSSLVMSLIQFESEDSSTQPLLRASSSKLLPAAQNISQVIQQQEPEDDSVGDATHPQDEKEKTQQASNSTESDAKPLQNSTDLNDNTHDTPSQIEETKGQ